MAYIEFPDPSYVPGNNYNPPAGHELLGPEYWIPDNENGQMLPPEGDGGGGGGGGSSWWEEEVRRQRELEDLWNNIMQEQIAEEKRRYAEAERRYNEALGRAQGAYEKDMGLANRRRDYWSGIINDPTSEHGYDVFRGQLHRAFQTALDEGKRNLQRRGLTGGAQDELQESLLGQRAQKQSDALMEIKSRAEKEFQAVPNPVFVEPGFQGIGSAPPQYNPVHWSPITPMAPPELSPFDYPNGQMMNSWLNALGQGTGGFYQYAGTMAAPGTQSDYQSTIPGQTRRSGTSYGYYI